MNAQDLKELDLAEIGDWPFLVKFIFVLIICALIVVGWYYYDTQGQLSRLKKEEAREVDLKQDYEIKVKKAANLHIYEKQYEELKERFADALRQLPSRTEVAELLVDVSQKGLASGLEFKLFKPTGEVPKDFYAELPIQIRVLGSYHEFGRFVSGLAELPRIVTVHNINISKAGGNATTVDGQTLLQMDMTAKTYRFLEGDGAR
ncbi:MAG: type 4a pilus biogenesis protein PilO [Chromatiales bacterium]|nr:type 4a pilus biogenesis protein PilO [Chromatiales bacterium]